MFGFLAKGPDPESMTCDEVIKGYKLNQRLAKERSKKHQKQHETRVLELKPRYERCTATAAGEGASQQGEEIQAVFDQIYDSGAGAGPAEMSMTASSGGGEPLIDLKKILLVGGIGVAGYLVFRAMKRRRK